MHWVTLRCHYDSTASYSLQSLYDFVVFCTFTFLKQKRKTIARRRVLSCIVQILYYDRAVTSCGNRANCYDNLGGGGVRTTVKERLQGIGQKSQGLYENRTGSVRFPLIVCGYPTISTLSIGRPFYYRTISL